MAHQINAHLLPELANPHDLAGNTFVVIDVLRASTTITWALNAGAHQIIPCLDVAESRDLARKHAEHATVVLGGERGGQPIQGFDLGNSPSEYTREKINGVRLVMSTTNGTRALTRCIGAGRILIGSFANLTALSDIVRHEQRLELICAGTNGQITREDTLFAGALVQRLLDLSDHDPRLNDQARLARDAWQSIGGFVPTLPLRSVLRDTQGGRNLLAIGRESDIDLAAQIDCAQIVPELDRSDWIIRAAK